MLYGSLQTQGIHIGDSFFSMRPLKEASPHEIYLRMSSAAKPNAPLKYYADVTGKFIVERKLGEDVEDKLRGRTIVAEKHRLDRKAIYLDAPPVNLNTNKKRKEAPPPARKTAPLPHRKNLAAPAPSQSPRVGSASPLPPTNSSSGDAAQSLRNRLIHCLAIRPRSTETLTRMTNGGNSDKEYFDLLREVCTK